MKRFATLVVEKQAEHLSKQQIQLNYHWHHYDLLDFEDSSKLPIFLSF